MNKILDNSLNRGNKLEILKWAFPDYSKAIEETKTQNAVWEAPMDGWVSVYAWIPNDYNEYTVFVNDNPVAKVYAKECNYEPHILFPVCKGDEIYHTMPTANVNKVVFFPAFGCDYVPPPASGYINHNASINDGYAENFNYDNYIMPDYTFAPSGKAWEIDFSIIAQELSPTTQFFLGTDEGETKGIVVGFAALNPSLSVSSDGSSWDFENAVNSNVTIQANTKYYYKVAFDGNNTYSLGVSTDGVVYDTITQNAGSILNNLPLLIGACWNRNNNQYLRGKMDLSDMVIKIDGATVWTAV